MWSYEKFSMVPRIYSKILVQWYLKFRDESQYFRLATSYFPQFIRIVGRRKSRISRQFWNATPLDECSSFEMISEWDLISNQSNGGYSSSIFIVSIHWNRIGMPSDEKWKLGFHNDSQPVDFMPVSRGFRVSIYNSNVRSTEISRTSFSF